MDIKNFYGMREKRFMMYITVENFHTLIAKLLIFFNPTIQLSTIIFVR